MVYNLLYGYYSWLVKICKYNFKYIIILYINIMGKSACFWNIGLTTILSKLNAYIITLLLLLNNMSMYGFTVLDDTIL